MVLPRLRQSIPPVPAPRDPWLARRYCPAGPPAQTMVEAGGGRVVSVPGRYCVTQVIEGPDRLALVDVGSVSDLPRIQPVVDWLDKPVGLVVPSHLHFDHVMGVDAAAVHFDAEVALGAVSRAFVERRLPLRAPANLTASFWLRVWLWQGLPVFHRADLPRGLRFGFPWSRNQFEALRGPVLADGQEVPGFPGWVTLETPGHADDAICLFHRAGGLLVAGDTVRNFEGGEWNSLWTDRAAYETTQARLAALDVQAVFPGHGPVLLGEGVLRRIPWDGVPPGATS